MLQEHCKFLKAIKNFSHCRSEEFMEKLCLAKPSLHRTTGPQTAALHLPPPGSWLQVSSPGLCITGGPGTFPELLYFYLPTLPLARLSARPPSPCSVEVAMAFHALCTAEHPPPSLSPTSRHLSSGQLSHLAGRKVIRVPTLGQHHVKAVLGRRGTQCCVALKPRPEK